jgi:uncharacterized protein YukE
MAQGFYGADPDQLRALAKQFSSGSNQIRSSLETVSSLVNSTQSWQGPDASAFQQRWNSQVKQLGNTVVHALELGSTTLIKNADEQTATSQVDGGPGGGGPGAPGTPGNPGPAGPKGSDDPDGGGFFSDGSPFRDAWGKWGEYKNYIGLPKNVLGMGLMMRQGADAFYDIAKWKDLANVNTLYGALDDTGNLLGLKNLNQYLPGLKGAAGFFEESPLFFKGMGDTMESLGKGGLGRALGWAGVGFNVYDAVEKAGSGDGWGAAGSVAKAALGVACFLPPPAGTVAQIGSAAIAIYEIPAVKEFVDTGFKAVGDTVASGAKAVGDTVSSAIKDPGKFASDVSKNIGDMGEGVKDFFGW